MIEEKKAANLDLKIWSELAKIGSTMAMSGLSKMINRDIKITTLEIEEVSILNVTKLVGAKEDMLIGVYLLFSGDAIYGQMLLAFQPQTAYQLVDMALDLEPNTTHDLDDMGKSTLAEIGNIVGTYFLNGVADKINLRLMPSPPAVVEDSAEAIITSVMVEAINASESTFVIKLLFSTNNQKIEGRFLVIPSQDFIDISRKQANSVKN
jgi:chemotaxis protein CheC